MEYFTKRYHPPGTSPGTLTASEPEHEVPLRIILTDYTDSEFTEKDIASGEESLPFLPRDTVTWIHVHGHANPETLRQLGKVFDLHPLALEDVINTGQRPKVDVYDGQLFVVMSHPRINGDDVEIEQVSLFYGKNYVISFYPGERDPFELVRRRLRTHASKIRARKADYLMYALLDVVVDEGFPVLEDFGDQVEELEQKLLGTPDRDTLRDIHTIKRELVLLRRMLWPQREVLNSLIRDEDAYIDPDIILYFRDCYDHTIQIMDLIETYRDMTTSMLDLYLSSVSNRLNDIMRVLTVIATIFIPLTFITGVYGMNFGNEKSPWAMPELHWYYGYPLIWGIMIALGAGMLVYFKRKRWF